MRSPLVGAALALAVAAAALPGRAQVYTRRNANGVIEATNVPDSSAYQLTYPGKGTLIHSRGFRRAYPAQYDPYVEEAARLYVVSADLIKAVISVESEFDQWAVSSKGAKGLMQLMPATARRFSVRDPFDARANILGGSQYLRILLDLFGGDVTLALAAYNAGENAVLRYGGVPPYKETRGYVAKIQNLLGATVVTKTRPASNGASAAFFTPSLPMLQTPAPAERRAATRQLTPIRPRTYYRWRDERGVTHVAEAPPPEGVVYQAVRALD